MTDYNSFRSELRDLINRHSIESGSNTSDATLADYLVNCLDAFEIAIKAREIAVDEPVAAVREKLCVFCRNFTIYPKIKCEKRASTADDMWGWSVSSINQEDHFRHVIIRARDCKHYLQAENRLDKP